MFPRLESQRRPKHFAPTELRRNTRCSIYKHLASTELAGFASMTMAALLRSISSLSCFRERSTNESLGERHFVSILLQRLRTFKRELSSFRQHVVAQGLPQ
jgi:hypothetical protein